MKDIDLVNSIRKKLNCAILLNVSKKILLTVSRSPLNRAKVVPHGYNTCFWHYKTRPNGAIHHLYVLDTVLIGTRSKENYDDALRSIFSLPVSFSALCLDIMYRGMSNTSSNIDSITLDKRPFIESLFNMANELHRTHQRYLR